MKELLFSFFMRGVYHLLRMMCILCRPLPRTTLAGQLATSGPTENQVPGKSRLYLPRMPNEGCMAHELAQATGGRHSMSSPSGNSGHEG